MTLPILHLSENLEYPRLPHRDTDCWMGCGEPRAVCFFPNDRGSYLSIYCKEHQAAPRVLARLENPEERA